MLSIRAVSRYWSAVAAFQFRKEVFTVPTSDPFSVPAVLQVIRSLKPKSVLDVGCGFGKYGLLLREYLDVAEHRYGKDAWQTKIYGLDAHEDYRTPVWDYVYDRVIIGDIIEIGSQAPVADVVLIADVIEHFDKDDAVAIVNLFLSHGSTLVITTPKVFYPQENEFDNEFERHRCLWTAEDTPQGFHCKAFSILSCNLFVLSRSPIDPRAFYPLDWIDLLYLRSRVKLGFFGIPLSILSRLLNRLFS